jgi:hypothetical protein
MLNALQHRSSPGVPVWAKKKKKIKNGGNPQLNTISQDVPKTVMLLHQ